jgi:hypothetical protein
LSRVALSVLLEVLEQFADPAIQQRTHATASHKATKIAEHAAQGILGTRRLTGGSIAKHVRQLGPILVTGDCEHTQEGGHRWHSAAHFRLLSSMIVVKKMAARLVCGPPVIHRIPVP